MTRRTKNISAYAAKSYMVSKFKSPHSDQKGVKSEMASSLVFWLYSLFFSTLSTRFSTAKCSTDSTFDTLMS